MTTQQTRIRFRCPKCDTPIKAPETAAGKNGTCPKCQHKLVIPHQSVVDDPNASQSRPPMKADGSPQTSMAMTIAGFSFEDDSGLTEPTRKAQPAAKPPVRQAVDGYVGKTLGNDFEIQSFLGAGGIARVYKARQKSLDRIVAMKILAGPNLTAQRVARFRREAITVGRLSHPNILQVYAFGADETLCWMSMEFIDGGDVYTRITKGKIPWQVSYQWFRQTLSGLQTAHDGGIVHRDLKPQNLMLTSAGVIRIADFGLVKVADDQAFLTGDGRTVGTPAYIAPEQALGEEVDTRADIYSLGATFYHVFAGVPPFRASSSTAILLKHVQETPQPLEDAAPHLPLPLCRVINRMLEKPRENRYQSAAVALADLDSYEKFGGLQARGPGDGKPAVGGSADSAISAEMLSPPPASIGGSRAGGSSQSNVAAADSKTCPFCGSTIKLSAVKCRYCGESLPAAAAGKV